MKNQIMSGNPGLPSKLGQFFWAVINIGYKLVFWVGTVGLLIWYVLKLQHQQDDLCLQVASLEKKQPVRTEIVERVVGASKNWSDVQKKIKNTVVQIFSQGAAIDIFQPFKTPSQFQQTGSGFFINQEGEFVTNAHVVDQARSMWIQIPALGKRQFNVELIGVCPDRDLALLKIEQKELEAVKKGLGGKLPSLNLGNSDEIKSADEIMTLGYPLGQQNLKSTVGVVSGWEAHFIQIDAPINPGNSGGPAVNRRGQVIGVNSRYVPDAQNVGYVIPINELKIILDDLRKVKLLRKPFLGILFENGTKDLVRYLNNPQPGGLYVVDVYQNSPLHRAGVKRADMIYEINGNKIDLYGELHLGDSKISIIDYVAQMKLGQDVHVVVYRSGKRHEFKFKFDQSELMPVKTIYPGYESIDYEIVAGMVIQPLTMNHLPALVNSVPSLAKYTEMRNQMKPALVITHIFNDSEAYRARTLVPGVIVHKVNNMVVKTMDDVRHALFKSVKCNDLTLETNDGIFVVFPFRKTLEDDQRLAQDYYYRFSPTMQMLLAETGLLNDKSRAMIAQQDNSIISIKQAVVS